MMNFLSKRIAQFDSKMVNRIETMVKQLRYNDHMHDDHEHKIHDADEHDRVANKAKRYIDKLEDEFSDLSATNSRMRAKLKENLEKRKELKYYIDQLKQAWDSFNGKHPMQKDIEQIKKENSKYEK